jgi:hypothetical protein
MKRHDEIMEEYHEINKLTGSPPTTLVLSQEIYDEICLEAKDRMAIVVRDHEIPPTFFGMDLTVVDGQGVFLWKMQ